MSAKGIVPRPVFKQVRHGRGHDVICLTCERKITFVPPEQDPVSTLMVNRHLRVHHGDQDPEWDRSEKAEKA